MSERALVEEDKLELAKDLEAKAKAKGVELLLPTDVVLADEFSPDANSKISQIDAISGNWMGLRYWSRFHKSFSECSCRM